MWACFPPKSQLMVFPSYPRGDIFWISHRKRVSVDEVLLGVTHKQRTKFQINNWRSCVKIPVNYLDLTARVWCAPYFPAASSFSRHQSVIQTTATWASIAKLTTVLRYIALYWTLIKSDPWESRQSKTDKNASQRTHHNFGFICYC